MSGPSIVGRARTFRTPRLVLRAFEPGDLDEAVYSVLAREWAGTSPPDAMSSSDV